MAKTKGIVSVRSANYPEHVAARVEMILRGISVTDMARRIGATKSLVSHALAGRRKSALRRIQRNLKRG